MTPSQIDVALDAWQAGGTARDIADALGVNANTLRVNIWRARKAGDPRAIWLGSGKRKGSVHRARRALYAQAHADGLSVVDAAQRIGVSRQTVHEMWRRMGLLP